MRVSALLRRMLRTHRRRAFGIGAAAVVAVMAVFIAPALGVLGGSPSNFESGDGNMIVDAAGHHDWANVAFVHTSDLSASNNDDSFTPGQKQDTTCPDITGHKNPPKDDFTDVARFSEVSSSGHTFLYGATIRYAANGNASENIELKQGTGVPRLCSSSSDLLQRVAGDKLIAIDYTGGGTSADFHILTWVTSGACFVSNDPAPCWGATVQDLSANSAEGQASQSAIAAADNPINGKALVAGQFAEFGIDLTDAGIVPSGSCSPFAQTVWESRSSGSSFVSSTKDIVRDDVSFSNCGTITVVKHTNPRGLDQDFSYTSNLKPNTAVGGNCSGVDAGGNFCLNDKNNTTGDSTANTVTEENLAQDTYTVTEGADPTGFGFDSVSCSPSDHVTIVDKQVTIALVPNDNITCTYVNNQLTGAIKVTKTSTKGGALKGATFSVKDSGGTAVSGSPLTTGDDGTACVDGLAFGTYAVKETGAPDGYQIDDPDSHNVVVDNGAKCSDNPYGGESKSYTDTPLTDVTVHAASEASGGTKSQITCIDAASADIGNSPQPSSSTFDDPVTVTANGLTPGTYTCTVIIDP